ncbi:hypothetical protein GCM10011405_18230 [Rufibacter glacialis]|uniref:hypothetical protein n=1 Tax=Rufibacter glacialis TaxID=1259555 RepID=UPI001788E1E0|nr:hypothetical protein [Rufibacter glacialis]GGK70516.1 hypothetical protein GCM10011405_18230 [Rufibacter glacialis]
MLLFLGIHFNLRAQGSLFEPGYLLKSGNDTVKGFIERSDEIKLSLGIHFKDEVSGVARYFGPEELEGFGFEGSGLHFARVKVMIRALAPADKVTRFAKKLVSGHTSLYKLQLQEHEQSASFLTDNTHVYVVKKDTSFFTLAQYELTAANGRGVDKRYLGMLTFLLKDCPAIPASVLATVPFQDAPLVQLLQKYNTCLDPASPSVEHHYTVASQVKKGPEMGYAMLYTASDIPFRNTNGYWAGFFWDVTKPDLSQRISSRLGINFLLMNYERQQEIISYDGSFHKREQVTEKDQAYFLRIPFAVQVNLRQVPKAAFSPFLNLGITPQVSFIRNLERFDYLPFLHLGAGAYVRQYKVSVSVENYGISPKADKIFSMGVGYVLKKRNQAMTTQ